MCAGGFDSGEENQIWLVPIKRFTVVVMYQEKKEQRIHILFEVKTFILTELAQQTQFYILVNIFV